MPHPTVTPVAAPNLVADTICRTAELGLSIDNAADAGDLTHLYCHPVTVMAAARGDVIFSDQQSWYEAGGPRLRAESLRRQIKADQSDE